MPAPWTWRRWRVPQRVVADDGDAVQALRDVEPAVPQGVEQQPARHAAAPQAASSDSGRKDVSSGGTAAPRQRRAAWSRDHLAGPRSRPGVGLISMFSRQPLARQKRAMFSKVGSGSPA